MLILNAQYPAQRITRQNMYGYFVKYLRKGKDNQPDVILIECNGVKYVVKDFYHKPITFKMITGTLITRIEYEAYRRLQGIEGIPKLYGMIDPFAIVIEYIEGKDLPFNDDDQIDTGTLRKIEKMINEIHHNGMVHTDLGHTDMGRSVNIIIDKHGNPYIIDFAGMIPKPPYLCIFANWIYRIFYRHDLRLIANLKNKYLPDELNEEDIELLKPKIPMELEFLKAIRKI